MGKRPRIGLLLAATSCLLAVMIDWVLVELNRPSRSSAAESVRAAATTMAGSS